MAGTAVKPKFTVEDAPKFTIEDSGPDISSEASMAAHPPAAPKPTMQAQSPVLAKLTDIAANQRAPSIKEMEASNVGAGKFGAEALGTQMIAGPLARTFEEHALPALKAAPVVGRAISAIDEAPGIGGKIVRGASVGGITGGVEGAVRGKGLVGSAEDALKGAAVGGGLGLALPAINRIASPQSIEGPGASLPSADEFYANRGAEINRAMKQQPEAFGIGKPEPQAQVGAPLPSAEQFYQNRGTDIMRAMRQQPEAFETPAAGAAPTVTKPSTNTGVAVLPEPRAPFEGETPNYMASVPRPKLERLALSGKPGAGTQLQQLGQRVIYAPRGEGIESPSMDALRQSLGIGSPEPSRITLNPVGGGGARPIVPENQFESSFGPEHQEVGDLAEWETGNREGVRPRKIVAQ
jgi:hypothetical protein